MGLTLAQALRATVASILLLTVAVGQPSLRGAWKKTIMDTVADDADANHDRRLDGASYRGHRLCENGVTTVYHQTDMAACRSILENGFDLAYSKPGNLGQGVYFADTAQRTGWKTRHWGCVIEVAIRLGNRKGLECTGSANGCENGWTWLPAADQGDRDYGSKLNCMGYDSLYTHKHGMEESIFFTDQIVDMIAYPTCTHFGCYERTGPYLNGRSELNIPAQCNASDFEEHCHGEQVTFTSITTTTVTATTTSRTESSTTLITTTATTTTATTTSLTESSTTAMTTTAATTSSLETCEVADCSAGYQPYKLCQCNDRCKEFGNCCSNYRDVCDAAAQTLGQANETVVLGAAAAGSSSRGQRLCENGVTKVYHQTDMEACRSILENGFDLAYSKPGNLGQGIYFTDTARATGWKTRHWGCVIEVAVRMGDRKGLECTGSSNGCENGWTWLPEADQGDTAYGAKLDCEGHDSLYTYKHGMETSIFFTDQIVDMVAYPTCTHFECYHRTGPYLNGRSELNIPQQCNANDFEEHCINGEPVMQTTTTTTSTQRTCWSSDCSRGYQPHQSCQCNDRCKEYGNCCSNYEDVCDSVGIRRLWAI
jgi:hypothetical protein